jgi:EAL domain-containing protein (putative c-di-GMP-specific phosphodiesterase class I)
MDAERAVSRALGKVWARGQVYGRARRILIDGSLESLLSRLEQGVGTLAEHVRVAPEDAGQTKWDAVGSLRPLPAATRQVRSLWLLDVLRSGELFVEFQTIFELRSGEPLGAEGLLRARASDGSVRLAVDIFPAAAALGIGHAFERLSWVSVLEASRRLPEDSMLFLNVNPQLLGVEGNGLSGLGEEAERVAFPYTRLALDLVEVERVESLERLSAALNVPHDLGVAIALDDVTSGYDTLRYCSGLAPRWIKVDSQITRGVTHDLRRRAVLKLLSQVGRESSVGLIAEGIESSEDLDVCVEEGVFAAQGYFLARPAADPAEPTPEFAAWLAARTPVRKAPPEEARSAGEGEPKFEL